MKKYSIKDGLVCRDIAGVYFIIDPFDRHFYRNKQVTCVNSMGLFIVKKMLEMKSFTSSDILHYIESNIVGEKPSRKIILRDINSLINTMETKGWVHE